MKVIVFAASKGGVAKTTLCYNLAIEAAKKSSVLIADLDPQQSLKEMWSRREELINPRLVSNVTNVSESVKLLKSAGYERKFILVDTPGSFIPVLRSAIAAAHLVVLPMQPSPLDLFAQEAVFDLVQEMGKTDCTMFVLTRADKRSDITKKSVDALKQRTNLPIPIIRQSVDYARSMAKGQAAGEINAEAAKDITGLWDAITAELAAQDLKHIERPADERKIH